MRTTGIRPSLNLNKITGLRPDNRFGKTFPKVKSEDKRPITSKSMKTVANVTRDGLKK